MGSVGPRRAYGINRRDVLKKALYGSLSAVGPGLWINGCSSRRRRKKPNIVFIIIDTLRSDHLGCCGYGRDTTPNIDSLAAEAKLFTNAVAAAPWTLPSIASMLSSRYPCTLGIREKIAVIDDGAVMPAQLLKQYGYRTHGVVSHSLLSARLGFGRGFDSYDESSSAGHGGISSPAVTRKAVALLREESTRPFFLFLHYFDPHYNFILHNAYNYYPSYRGGVRSNHPILDLWRIRNELSADDIKYLVNLYDSEISFTDKYVGDLFDFLRQRRLFDDSIIIVTADHGEEFMERGWIGHTITLHRELIGVPLIIKCSGYAPGVIDSGVGLIDIMPTIYSRLGLDIPEGAEGGPLELRRDSLPDRPIFSETFNPQSHQPEKVESIAYRSVISGGSKLIYDQIGGEKQIYDLVKDPAETHNLAGKSGDKSRELGVLLSGWISRMDKEQPKTQDGVQMLTPQQREQLKSLGYL